MDFYALTWYLLMLVLHVGLEMDIRDLKFPDQSFDVVIDKGKRVDDQVHWLVGNTNPLCTRYHGCSHVRSG